MNKTIFHNVTVELKRGDISAQDDMDAVVNAANATLSGGGGVDGALHRAAGPELKKASQPLGPIAPGEAVITPAFNLPNKFVIHCLGPVYGQDHPEATLLANCYKNALRLAEDKQIQRIAFPAISAGVFGYPMEEAATVALQTLKKEVPNLERIQWIRIVLWSQEALTIHKRVMEKV